MTALNGVEWTENVFTILQCAHKSTLHVNKEHKSSKELWINSNEFCKRVVDDYIQLFKCRYGPYECLSAILINAYCVNFTLLPWNSRTHKKLVSLQLFKCIAFVSMMSSLRIFDHSHLLNKGSKQRMTSSIPF